MAATDGSVRLLGFPLRLFGAAESLWHSTLREYLLRGMEDHDQPYDIDAIHQARAALDTISEAATRPTAADDEGEPTFRADLSVDMGASTPSDFAMLQGVLDDALRLTRTGELLALPPLPELVALRNWICDEVTAQAVGAGPTAWALPAGVLESHRETADWDRAIAPSPSVGWLVGDDHNRVVGVSFAALELLGWDEAELLGQRLLVVVPPAMRDRHVAGFSRSVVLGEHGLLGQPLQLAALHHDGHEVPITLTLSRHPARGGRTVYLALVEPRASE